MKVIRLSGEKFSVVCDNLNEIMNKVEVKFESKTEFIKKLLEQLPNKYKFRTLYRNVESWKKGERRIPLDCLLSVSKLADISASEIFSQIRSICLVGCRSPIHVFTFPLKLDENWGFVSECARVEGTVGKKFVHFTNSDILLLKTFENNLSKIGVPKENFEEKLRVMVEVPSESKKSDTKLFKLNGKEKKELNFRFREIKLKDRKRKEMVFQDGEFNYFINRYKIVSRKNSISIEVKVPRDSKITSKSTHGVIYSAIELRVHNKTLAWILNNIFRIPFGKKSRTITIPHTLKSSSNEVFRAIIDAVLSCESCFSVPNMWIRVQLTSKNYLFDLKNILSKLNISSNLSCSGLTICGKLNFERIQKIGISHSKKRVSLDELLNNYKIDQCPKGKAELFYLKCLSELGEATWSELAEYTERRGNGSRVYLRRLTQKRFISASNSRPKTFKLTDKGREFLRNSDTSYWEG